jgi:hypothetical protein
LGAAFVVLFLINSFVFMPASSNAPGRQVILPFYGIFMLLCGLSAGSGGLVAVVPPAGTLLARVADPAARAPCALPAAWRVPGSALRTESHHNLDIAICYLNPTEHLAGNLLTGRLDPPETFA